MLIFNFLVSVFSFVYFVCILLRLSIFNRFLACFYAGMHYEYIMDSEKHIVLVGMMGVGKTSLGKLLSDSLSFGFVDIDSEIVKEAGMSISQIFDKYGESYFRTLEADTMRQYIDKGAVYVISTGGGAMMTASTASLILKDTLSIWIDVDLDVLVRRIGEDENRPLLQGEDVLSKLKTLAKTRYPVYKQADIHIQSGDEPIEKTFEKILDAVNEYQFK